MKATRSHRYGGPGITTIEDGPPVGVAVTPHIKQSKTRSTSIILLSALVLMTALGCTSSNAKSAPPTPPAPLVTAVQARSQDVPRYLDEVGRNVGFETVTVTPQVGGRIIERRFKDGDNLKRGQLLFMIDPRPYKAQLNAAQATLAQNKAALEFARIQFQRDAEIINTRAISREDYDTKKNAVDVAQSQVDAAEAAVETAKLNLEYCYIRSPINGRAGARLQDVGNIVAANVTQLLSIQRLDPIYATFTITERDLPDVQKQMAQDTLKALVWLPTDQPNIGRNGKIEFLDNAVQNGTGTVNLRATLPNNDGHFWPGQFVNVKLVLSTTKGAVLIPNQATQISQQGPFVFVVKQDDSAELRRVVLGQKHGSDVVITSGLQAGERVVVDGQLTVRPGEKVRVASDQPAMQPRPASAQ
jgi:multidrug efflux system membrane fusion protein